MMIQYNIYFEVCMYSLRENTGMCICDDSDRDHDHAPQITISVECHRFVSLRPVFFFK